MMLATMKTCGLPAPITSAVMKSPTDGMKVSSEPATTPGRESRKVTRQKAWARLAYRSVAASMRRRSIFSMATYSGRIMNGRKLEVSPEEDRGGGGREGE